MPTISAQRCSSLSLCTAISFGAGMPGRREELAAVARVFAGHHVGGAECGGGARRQVAEVADRRGDDDELAGSVSHRVTSSGRRGAAPSVRTRQPRPRSHSAPSGTDEPTRFGFMVSDVDHGQILRRRTPRRWRTACRCVWTDIAGLIRNAPSIPSRPSSPLSRGPNESATSSDASTSSPRTSQATRTASHAPNPEPAVDPCG